MGDVDLRGVPDGQIRCGGSPLPTTIVMSAASGASVSVGPRDTATAVWRHAAGGLAPLDRGRDPFRGWSTRRQYRDMTERTLPSGHRRRWPWLIWAATLAGLVPTIVLSARNRSFDEDPLFIPIAVMMITGYSTVGAILLARTRGNPIGWLLMAVGMLFVLVGMSDEYLQYADATGRIGSTAVELMALLTTLVWAPMLGIVALLLLLFPSGTVPGPRWRPLPWVIIAANAVFVIASILRPGPLDSEDVGIEETIVNPLGVEALGPVTNLAAAIGSTVALLAIPPALVGLLVRFRRSRNEERQQIRWLAYVVSTIAVLVGLQFPLAALPGDPPIAGLASDALFLLSFFLLGVGIPVAMGIAVLRYRLYDLDVVVKKTVVFGVLVVLVMGASLAALLAISSPLTDIAPDETQAVGVAMFVVGVSVWPLWRVARWVADRIVYGGRATPYEVLTEFSSRVGETYVTDDVLPRMAQLLGEATGAQVARVWLHVGRDLRPAASWPRDAPVPAVVTASVDRAADPSVDPAADRAATAEVRGFAEVRHAGETLGALSIEMPASDPIGPAKERIVRDLAAQAGPVLRNVRLIEELRDSRRRIVAAQDDRAKKLERNIHDGAQQQLVALSVKARLASTVATKDAERATALLDEIQRDLHDALENLRDLARGIYPPLLADQGLASALTAQARKSPVPVTVDANGTGRFPPDVEATVYFSVLEALQNVAKYAAASSATVELSSEDGQLSFRVTDDGRGFDAAAVAHGSGLQGIADRLAAVGGNLEVTSAPGRGTTVAARVPLERRMP
jgi:signal transduction histidine kinase